jgi:omega-6 fatty acid desaturase (delta-12 desaturase)
MNWSLGEIRAAIPAKYFVRDTARGLRFCVRDFIIGAVFWYLATFIDPIGKSNKAVETFGTIGAEVFRWSLWGVYWWFQGLNFTGIWVIGHESGHGAFSANRTVCDIVGFITHTLMWTPYFSWRISHHRHHSNHASMEKDEVYVPKTRSDLGIPEGRNEDIDWEHHLGDTPLFTLLMLIRQQVLAFPAYLLFNVSGQKSYPKWTNHFDPNSVLFNPSQRNAVIASNLGIFAMIWGVTYASTVYGTSEVIKYYFLPWLCVSHWFIMITYLHHTDENLPHYRKSEWSFQRGAACTVDRPFLGWQGRFFLHDVAHYHVIHHFFPQMPFYHGEAGTQHLKAFIGEYYAESDQNCFGALWQAYNNCQFVEDDGEIVFYRNKKGEAVVRPADPWYSPSSKPAKSVAATTD